MQTRLRYQHDGWTDGEMALYTDILYTRIAIIQLCNQQCTTVLLFTGINFTKPNTGCDKECMPPLPMIPGSLGADVFPVWPKWPSCNP